MTTKATTLDDQIKVGSYRLVAIDAFRALTMFFMIFVNDLWTLKDVPKWLEHVDASTDGMGFSDIIFPLFLFIVGLSIPYAIDGKQKKGGSKPSIFKDVLKRTFALLVMGFYLVNAEYYSAAAWLPKSLWTILLIIGFFLIWRTYTKEHRFSLVLRWVGAALLAALALAFQRADGALGPFAMQAYWWGILGLIGWGYFTAAVIYLIFARQYLYLVVSFVMLLCFNVASHLQLLDGLHVVKSFVWLAGDGAMAAFCMAGVLITLIYRKLTAESQFFWIICLIAAVILISFGLISRPLWGISKIHATPSWIAICTGIAILSFLLMILLTDRLKFKNWYTLIKPAGSSTLTCYLIPYIHYALIGIVGVQLPLIFRTGSLGLIKSLLYALIIIMIAGILEKKRWKLKI